ncbi:MAG: sulfatase, partial [Candidatus Sumerlaeota bacterium]|nr:sulfatase [Candidatus Sumerlaeota bacterium]
IAHGLAGLGAGLGLACVALFFSLWRDRFWAPATTFGFSAAGAFGAMGFVFFRFRYVRDFLDEQKPPLSDDLHLLLIAALGFVVIYCAFRWLARRRWLGALARLSGGLGLFAAVSAVFLGYGWAKWQAETGPPAPPPAPPELAGRANVLLIVVDTLRADHTNPYGCTALQTPVLNALAADGVVFEQAVAQASWTRPSIATILTGLYPSTHGAASKADRLGAKAPTLPQTLRDAGFFTVGLVNNFNISGYFGFNKGFTHYRYLKPTFHLFASDSCSRLAIYDILRAVREKVLQRLRGKDYVDVMDFYWPAEKVVDVADDWLDRFKDTPFFYFVHFMDPHDPYMLHPLSLRKGFARLGWGSLTSQDRDPLHDAYLGEIQYVDGEIGRLVAHLKEQGLYDNMAIILTGDHGEEFLDHGGWWHGRTLYEEMIHVPLIVKLPGNALAGTRVPYQVRHIDIAPTICRLMGVEPPPFMQGVPLVQGGQLADPKLDLVFSQEDFEANVVQSARGLRWKLQVANQGNPRGLDTVGLYDLQSPMKENFNLALIEPQRVHEMDSWLLKELNKAEEKGKEYR